MLNGLDLFSGIGGMSVALSEYVRPVAYCEIDTYCQGVLLSRMADGLLPRAPIWDNVSTLQSRNFGICIDIIYGGFPCQGLSVAGLGKGLEDERSGLFFEIVRLAQEIKPTFIFLENVPAITARGGLQVVESITEMGYDCRWCVISAASVGALHIRERWFLLANATSKIGTGLPLREKKTYTESGSAGEHVAHSNSERLERFREGEISTESKKSMLASSSSNVAYSRCESKGCIQESRKEERTSFHNPRCGRFWEAEPNVGRVADGIPNRMDRIKSLGNSVVPKQAKEAFEILMGLKKWQKI